MTHVPGIPTTHGQINGNKKVNTKVDFEQEAAAWTRMSLLLMPIRGFGVAYYISKAQ